MEPNATVINATILTIPSIITPGAENGIFSKDLRDVFEVVNYVTISAAIGLFGICTNVINIVVFVKLGFKDVINISLFALAVSDLTGLVILEWFNICINPYFRKVNLPFIPSEILYVTAGWPHSCFMKITCLVTAFVTFERCLCITLPLKVKTLLTPSRARLAIAVICILVFVSAVPAYMTVKFQWRFDQDLNRNVLGISIDKSRTYVTNIAFIVNTIMQILAFGSVVVTTIILVKKLNEKAKWRESTSSYGKAKDGTSLPSKDKALVRMIIVISVILILCCTPGSTFFVISLMVREFSVTGRYKNAYSIAWSFAYITDAINPSVSTFVYLAMSSRYRKGFQSLFKRCLKNTSVSDGSSYTSTTCNTTRYESDTTRRTKGSLSDSANSEDS